MVPWFLTIEHDRMLFLLGIWPEILCHTYSRHGLAYASRITYVRVLRSIYSNYTKLVLTYNINISESRHYLFILRSYQLILCILWEFRLDKCQLNIQIWKLVYLRILGRRHGYWCPRPFRLPFNRIYGTNSNKRVFEVYLAGFQLSAPSVFRHNVQHIFNIKSTQWLNL